MYGGQAGCKAVEGFLASLLKTAATLLNNLYNNEKTI